MPNFWSQTTQSIYELFNGPRTVDTEFEEKQKELKASIESMGIINQTVKNFSNQTQGLRNFCQNVYNNLTKSYSRNSVYYPFIADLAETHKKVENAYNICSETLKNIQIKNVEWDKIFNDVQNGLQKREEARKIYDHYDEKMEKLVKERNEKLAKKIQEDEKDIAKFNRNDGKYKKAASDFISLSNYTYRRIQDLLDMRYQMLNPLICAMVNAEKQFFDSCSSFFQKFDGSNQKFFGLDRGFQKTPINYDPTKHIRAAKLLQGVNVNMLPQVKNKAKYSYQDYQKNINQNKMNTSNNQNNGYTNSSVASNPYNINNKTNNSNSYNYNSYIMKKNSEQTINNKNNNYSNNQSNNMKFTYQDYLKNKQQNPNNNNNDNNPYGKDEFSFGKTAPPNMNLVFSQAQNQFENRNYPNDQNKSHL